MEASVAQSSSEVWSGDLAEENQNKCYVENQRERTERLFVVSLSISMEDIQGKTGPGPVDEISSILQKRFIQLKRPQRARARYNEQQIPHRIGNRQFRTTYVEWCTRRPLLCLNGEGRDGS